MSEKSALFMARTTRFHEFARSLTTTLGVEVSLATPDSPTAAHDFDLLILDSDGIRSDRIDQIAKWLDDRGGVPMLVIVDDEALGTLRLPNHAHADFVCPTATPNELKARAQRLMGEEETVTADDVLNIDNLEINLATYQVTLDNEPIDLTLMEYSLLSFLATHPNRAYSREVLLHRAPSTCTFDASVPRWARRSRHTSPPSAAWAICLRTRFPPQGGQAPLRWFCRRCGFLSSLQ